MCVSPHRCSAASVCPASVARQATLFADGLPARRPQICGRAVLEGQNMVIRKWGPSKTRFYHMVSRMVTVKINHMVKIWKISSKNPNHYYLLNLHLQLLKFQIFAAKQQAARHQADDNDVTDRQRRDRPRARPRGRTPGARSAPRLPCLPVPARQRRTAGLRRRPACCDAGRLCARGQALECRMDARRVARTGVCARIMPVQLLAVGSHGGTAHGNAVFCASLPAG